MPRCPLRLPQGAGFRYGLDFLDAFAENVRLGLTYAGIIYEGPVLQMARDVPQGGLDVLDTKLNWLLPRGVLKCISPRELQRATADYFV